jgi:hypothetical protein
MLLVWWIRLKVHEGVHLDFGRADSNDQADNADDTIPELSSDG